ncbi:hypothetical protein KCP71_02225 [Salmonella enterica subsp. enterica]|nr:hypothetical protein KCP71_02225 [Salmonella enterica subsp. enterica]
MRISGRTQAKTNYLPVLTSRCWCRDPHRTAFGGRQKWRYFSGSAKYGANCYGNLDAGA